MSFTLLSLENEIKILTLRDLYNEMDNKDMLIEVKEAIQHSKNHIIADLKDLPIINSVGLNFLINLKHIIEKKEGKLVLVNISKHIRRLLSITKLDALFFVKQNENEAIAFIEQNILKTNI